MEFIEKDNIECIQSYFETLLKYSLRFKARPNVMPPNREKITEWSAIEPPLKGVSTEKLLEYLIDIAENSSNFGSPNFLGFPDAGNSVAANLAGMLVNFINQNMINESFCAPSATFVELETIHWLRTLAGYESLKRIHAASDVGGVAVIGGVQSNTIGLLGAREKLYPGSLVEGLTHQDLSRTKIITPESINHYSIRCSLGWLGLGEKAVLQAPIDNNYKYNIELLRKFIQSQLDSGYKIMALVAYAGDSRTQSIDRLSELGEICKAHNIWFHVDACHGVQLLFSEKLKSRLEGIEKADSIAVDPHKVLWIPYNLSYALFKNPKDLENIGASSDLITKERWAFGQFTPFTGSKAFNSLKLWALMKHLGVEKIGKLVEKRLELVQQVQKIVDNNEALIRVNETDINSIAFLYLPPSLRNKNHIQISVSDIDELNDLNKLIHAEILKQGYFYIHTFTLPDHQNLFHLQERYMLQVLRFMPGHPSTELERFREALNLVVRVGDKIVNRTKYKLTRINKDNSPKAEVIRALQGEVQSIIKTDKYFTLIYGSCVYKENPFRSDVDLITAIEDQYYSEKCKKDLIRTLMNLHKKFHLKLDEEVPFETKILIAYSEAEKAIAGAGLKTERGRVIIPPIDKSREFLSSKSMCFRLFHNAVTTNGLVICGDEEKYHHYREEGLTSLIWILIHQLPRGCFCFDDLRNILYSNGNVEGEYYLGYKNIPFVCDELERSLKNKFAELVESKVLVQHCSGGYYLSHDFDMKCLKQLFTELGGNDYGK